MSSFSTTPQYIEVIVGFIDNKIKQVEDKLFIKPKEDEEEKVIIEQLLFAEYKGSARIINPKLSEQESVKLHQELDVLESFKTISPEEAFNNNKDVTIEEALNNIEQYNIEKNSNNGNDDDIYANDAASVAGSTGAAIVQKKVSTNTRSS